MYEILIEGGAEKDLKSLSSPTLKRISKCILSLRYNPRGVGAKKIIGSKNDWRLRVGNYRIIYEIDDQKKIAYVFRIKHRREAYRKL